MDVKVLLRLPESFEVPGCKLILSINNGTISNEGVFLTDMNGKKYSGFTVSKLSSTKLEIKLPTGLTNGIYYINVKINNDYKVLRIVKM